MGNMEVRVTEMVTKVVEKAMEAVATKLEGRVSRAREHQDSLIHTMKSDLDQFQVEMRSTMTNFQSVHLPTVEKGDEVTANGESSVQGAAHTPYRQSIEVVMGSPVGERHNSIGGGFGGDLAIGVTVN